MKDVLALLNRVESALYNVPIVGEVYDQQHSDTHMVAVLDLKRIMVLINGNVFLNKDKVKTVLQALVSPPHHIRELQATRGALFDNPIDTLVMQYNAQVES